ncbi:1,4-dihydroxy-2-naphthoate octaprenyltransferase [Alloscardovia criceti]|uniref:1,4-dihydroxy-2-naphthoate octaprenyltransferase n=1 Tax=Alloscardovia criceti TaxID=356828 RepID=UPI00036B89A2|nr:1,4-dihydroxy-2-naphthoate octaprenyltransferase [Alloscardovia criceti]
MKGVKQILQGSRPLTWALSVCPVLVAAICASMDRYVAQPAAPRHVGRAYDYALVVLSCVVALSLQISANFINDYLDGVRGIDRVRLPEAPKRLNQTARGIALARAAAVVSAVIGVCAGLDAVLISRKYWLLGVGVLCVLAAWAYSACASSHGWGEVLAFVFFGPVVVCAVEALLIDFVGPWGIMASVQCGLASAVVLLINNMRDEDSDRKASKRTMVVRWGSSRARSLFRAAVGVILMVGVSQVVGTVLAVETSLSAKYLALSAVVIFCEMLAGITGTWSIRGATAQPKKYRWAFMCAIVLMILVLAQHCVVLIVVNAL